jgi:hypothetical protein
VSFGQDKKLSEIYLSNPGGIVKNRNPAELGVLLKTKKESSFLSLGLSYQSRIDDAELFFDSASGAFRYDERLKHQIEPYDSLRYRYHTFNRTELGFSIGIEKKTKILNLPMFARTTLINSIGFIDKNTSEGNIIYTDSFLNQTLQPRNFYYDQWPDEWSNESGMFYTVRVNSQVGFDFTIGKHFHLSPMLDVSFKYIDQSHTKVAGVNSNPFLVFDIKGLMRLSYSL